MIHARYSDSPAMKTKESNADKKLCQPPMPDKLFVFARQTISSHELAGFLAKLKNINFFFNADQLSVNISVSATFR